jgi:hypothetical protein
MKELAGLDRRGSAESGPEPQHRERCTFNALRRVTLSLLVTAIAAGVAALPAAAKEGVKAKLATSVPLHAEPGARLRVAWTLTYAEGDNRGRPFGANGVFVRLLSASGARAETGFAPTGAHATGEYAATVVVPKGGIGDVEIGLLGWTSGAGGARRSDLLFPITNDPLPGSVRVASPPSEQAAFERADGNSTAWIFVVGLASLLALSALAVAVARRKHASQA